MIPRLNKVYHFDELIEATQCRKCKETLEWCCCEPSQGIMLEADCCGDHHYVHFKYNDGFELRGKYERSNLQRKNARVL